MTTTDYWIAAIIFALLALGVYVWWNIRDLKKDMAMDRSDLNAKIKKAGEANRATKAKLNHLERATPRTFINDRNEAIITLPDGKTEIHNYKLNRKKK